MSVTRLSESHLEAGDNKTSLRGFPGGPVNKTSSFQCREHGFLALVGEQDPICHTAWQKRKINLLQLYPVLVHFSSVAQSYSTLCSRVYCSTPGFPVHHQLLESAQTHIHRVGDVT